MNSVENVVFVDLAASTSFLLLLLMIYESRVEEVGTATTFFKGKKSEQCESCRKMCIALWRVLGSCDTLEVLFRYLGCHTVLHS